MAVGNELIDPKLDLLSLRFQNNYSQVVTSFEGSVAQATLIYFYQTGL